MSSIYFKIMIINKLKEKNIFDSQLRLEVLQGERLREFILGGAILLLTLGLILNVFFLSENYREKVPELINAFEWIIFLFLMLGLRSFIVRLVIRKRMDKGKGLPYLLRYVNSFFEVTIPSLGIIILSLHIEPIAALVSPMLLLYFLFIILSSLELDPRLSFFTGFVASIEYLLISLFYITNTEHHSNIPVLDLPIAYLARSGILFVSGIVAGLVSLQIRKRILNTYSIIEERNELEKVFGQQVSKEIVDEFINNKLKLQTGSSEATIMFLDIRDFSKFCEGKTPEEINKYQNQVLSFMIDIVKQTTGIVNQILGDGFMATFGAPVEDKNHADNAVKAASEIIRQLN